MLKDGLLEDPQELVGTTWSPTGSRFRASVVSVKPASSEDGERFLVGDEDGEDWVVALRDPDRNLQTLLIDKLLESWRYRPDGRAEGPQVRVRWLDDLLDLRVAMDKPESARRRLSPLSQ